MDEQLDAAELEEIGDLPTADINPPDNVLFVGKLNSITKDETLKTQFSKFGTVTSADIIRDSEGKSLCYAFIEFADIAACQRAYFKMNSTIIDGRIINVEFSQGVSRLWNRTMRKGNQARPGGNGCSKCGSVDHIARDCNGSPDTQQPPKYVLKDDGGSSRYDMVYNEDTHASPQRKKQPGHHEVDDRHERKLSHQATDERKHNDYKHKDERKHNDRRRKGSVDDRRKEHRQDDRYHKSGGRKEYKRGESDHRTSRNDERHGSRMRHDRRRDNSDDRKRYRDDENDRKGGDQRVDRNVGADDSAHKRRKWEDHRVESSTRYDRRRDNSDDRKRYRDDENDRKGGDRRVDRNVGADDSGHKRRKGEDHRVESSTRYDRDRSRRDRDRYDRDRSRRDRD